MQNSDEGEHRQHAASLALIIRCYSLVSENDCMSSNLKSIKILKCAIFPCFDSPIAFLCQGPTFRKLKERYQSNYRGLEEDDDSEHEAERSTNVFDPRHQEINS